MWTKQRLNMLNETYLCQKTIPFYQRIMLVTRLEFRIVVRKSDVLKEVQFFPMCSGRELSHGSRQCATSLNPCESRSRQWINARDWQTTTYLWCRGDALRFIVCPLMTYYCTRGPVHPQTMFQERCPGQEWDTVWSQFEIPQIKEPAKFSSYNCTSDDKIQTRGTSETLKF